MASWASWLLIFPTVGALISTKFNYPSSLAARVAHVRAPPAHPRQRRICASRRSSSGCHYIVPRLCGVRLWGAVELRALWVWNLNLALAVILLAPGWNRGWEAGELPLINVVITFSGSSSSLCNS
jgi:cbb3-type cytochrome oxidase subunit 1